ncbi:Probable folate-biopterin transporter 4 [Linum grandiflorum]
MREWTKQMKRSFGGSFLWLVCLIYFTQGFRSFVWTAVSYQMKDKLKLSPSASQFVSSVAFFPWSIKPIYGIVSDCISIKGRKRVPYLIIATVLSLVPWPILGLNSTFRNSSWYLMVLLTAQNLGSAMADVVVDAMIAEAVRFEKASFAGDLQSLSWFSMALGGICGSLLGGFALSNLPIDTIFLLFSVLPAIQLFSCCLVEENPVVGEVVSASDDSDDANGSSHSDDNSYLLRKSSTTSSRRRKKQKKGKKKKFSSNSQVAEKRNSGKLGWYYSLKSASYSLLQAFRQPIILRPMAWFFLAHITYPNLSTVMFYYQTEFLNLDAAFLGTTRVVGWLGLMLGTFVYNRHLKTMKLRKILLYTHIGLSLLTFLDMVLVSRMNVAYGITDKHMVLFGSALADAINQFKFMPFLILSGQLCPPGIEGTLFALFMSINNLGSTVGSFVGAGLASLLNLSSGSYDNLLLGIAIQVACIYIPVLFLFLIPKEATGVSSST